MAYMNAQVDTPKEALNTPTSGFADNAKDESKADEEEEEEENEDVCSNCKKDLSDVLAKCFGCDNFPCNKFFCKECKKKKMHKCRNCTGRTCVGCSTIYECDEKYCPAIDDDVVNTVCSHCEKDNKCSKGDCDEIVFPCCARECETCGYNFCEAHIEARDPDNAFLCDGCEKDAEEARKEEEGSDEDEGEEKEKEQAGEKTNKRKAESFPKEASEKKPKVQIK